MSCWSLRARWERGGLSWQPRAARCAIATRLAERQILAALGQPRLMTLYQDLLAPHGIIPAQILLTKQDFRTRDHHKNIAHLFAMLHGQPHILPVVNENDSVAITELMFTDNDELAGLLAAMLNADRLIILSNIAGVYDCPPDEPGAAVIPVIDWQEKKSAVTVGKSKTGRGGMASKLGIAKKMAMLGIRTHIASAREPEIIGRIMRDETGRHGFPAAIRQARRRKAVARQRSPYDPSFGDRQHMSCRHAARRREGVQRASGRLERHRRRFRQRRSGADRGRE
ncbi:MAG: hypothetical protein WDO70_12425 [Alphaproteobacteria bacterium]